jgi:hypothetical protein
VADDVADASPNNVNEFKNVSDVAVVAQLAGHTCAQCDEQSDVMISRGSNWWHPECWEYRVRRERGAA